MSVEACCLYLECDYLISPLKALASFTFYITLPFLNSFVKTDQNDLVKILPQLYNELSDSKLETLSPFARSWKKKAWNKNFTTVNPLPQARKGILALSGKGSC